MLTRSISIAIAVSLALHPLTAQQQWRLVVEQRFILDDGPSEPIKAVRDFAVGAGGRIYVLENTVKQVHVYIPQGKYWKSFSREGSGPGELRDANGIVLAEDGSLLVNDHGNARISTFSADGAYLRQIPSTARGYSYRWEGFVNAGIVHDVIFRGARRLLARRKLDGTTLDSVDAFKCPGAASPRKTYFVAQTKNRGMMSTEIPFMQQARSTIDPRGGLWCVSGAEYKVVRLDLSSGKETAIARRDVKPTAVPARIRDAEIRRIREAVSKYESTDADYSLVPNEYPFLSALTVDDGGRLWAHRPDADSTRSRFDVFDETGKFLSEVTLPERMAGFQRIIIRGDAFYAVTLDADDVPGIVRARISRPQGE